MTFASCLTLGITETSFVLLSLNRHLVTRKLNVKRKIMNTTTMIEPCCCDRQLPALLRDMGGRAMMFTNGDVTVKHVFNAVSSLAGPNHRMTLVVQEPDVEMMRWLRLWMQRGWTTEVRMTARQDVRKLISAELDGLTERVTLAVDATMQSEMIAFEGERGVVVVCGPMLTRVAPGITTYACYHGKERGAMAELLAAVEARQRSHKVTIAQGDSPRVSSEIDTQGTVPEEAPAPTKTKTKTKKAKKNGNTETVAGETPTTEETA